MSNEAPVGWSTNERIEKQRGEWIAAPNAEARKEIAGETQTAAFEDVPYIPTGSSSSRPPTARISTG